MSTSALRVDLTIVSWPRTIQSSYIHVYDHLGLGFTLAEFPFFELTPEGFLCIVWPTQYIPPVVFADYSYTVVVLHVLHPAPDLMIFNSRRRPLFFSGSPEGHYPSWDFTPSCVSTSQPCYTLLPFSGFSRS